MICSFCGAKVPDGQKTCPACGAAVSLADDLPSPSPYYKEMVGADLPKPVPPEPIPEVVVTPEVLEPPEYKQAEEAVTQVINDRSNWAVASLVCGILGIVLNFVPPICSGLASIPAIVLGFMSLKSKKRNYAIAGIVLGILDFVIDIVLIFLAAGLIVFGMKNH
jgi:hypothetical protein